MMIQFQKEFDFLEMLLPHGEDDVSYSYSDGEFKIIVTYDDTKKLILRFSNCQYQAFHPIPGVNILSEPLDFWGGEAGCVYRLDNTDLLSSCEDYALEAGLPFKARYFYCRFDSFNLGFHVVADIFSYEFA